MTGNYVKTIYDPQKRPVTDYPDRLAGYILSRYHIKPMPPYWTAGAGEAILPEPLQERGRRWIWMYGPLTGPTTKKQRTAV